MKYAWRLAMETPSKKPFLFRGKNIDNMNRKELLLLCHELMDDLMEMRSWRQRNSNAKPSA